MDAQKEPVFSSRISIFVKIVIFSFEIKIQTITKLRIIFNLYYYQSKINPDKNPGFIISFSKLKAKSHLSSAILPSARSAAAAKTSTTAETAKATTAAASAAKATTAETSRKWKKSATVSAASAP